MRPFVLGSSIFLFSFHFDWIESVDIEFLDFYSTYGNVPIRTSSLKWKKYVHIWKATVMKFSCYRRSIKYENVGTNIIQVFVKTFMFAESITAERSNYRQQALRNKMRILVHHNFRLCLVMQVRNFFIFHETCFYTIAIACIKGNVQFNEWRNV